jgi:hypothetical protein
MVQPPDHCAAKGCSQSETLCIAKNIFNKHVILLDRVAAVELEHPLPDTSPAAGKGPDTRRCLERTNSSGIALHYHTHVFSGQGLDHIVTGIIAVKVSKH